MSRLTLSIALILGLSGGCRLSAQQVPPKPTPPVVKADTGNKASAEADTTKEGDDAEQSARSITTGISFGGLNYSGGRSERATSASLHWRALPWLSIGATPTFARAVEPIGAALTPVSTKTGLTDLPIDIGADHAFDLPLSPSIGVGLGITLPIGDTASGFGAGKLGSSISLSAGFSPTDFMGLNFGVGRALTDFSVESSFNGTSSEFGDVGMSLHPGDRVSFSMGLDGEIGAVDTSYGRSSSLSGGVSFSLPYINSISLNASHGLGGSAPSWSFALGMGTDFAALGSVTLHSVSSRLRRAFGGGRHGLPTKGSKTPPPGRKKKP